MNLEHLQTFLFVAESGGFSHASTALGVSKGLVSRHIQKLEDTLKTKLFHRTTRQVTLTEAGNELYRNARQIKMLAAEAEMRIKDLAQDVSGELKVTAPIGFGRVLCKDIVPELRAQYPALDLTLDFGADRYRIEMGEYDVALRAYDDLPNEVIAKELGLVKNILVGSPEYLQERQLFSLDDLLQHEFIVNTQNNSWNVLKLQCDYSSRTMELTGKIGANNYQSILELVLHHQGIASLPFYLVADLIENRQLTHVLKDWSIYTHKISLIYARQRVIPKKVVIFNHAIMSWFQNNRQFFLCT